MPRAPFHNGVTDQTCLLGQEYPGLCLIAPVAMKGMLPPVGPEIENAFYNLIFMALCLFNSGVIHRSQTGPAAVSNKEVPSNFPVGCWAFLRMFFPLQIADPKVSWVASHCVLYSEVWEH